MKFDIQDAFIANLFASAKALDNQEQLKQALAANETLQTKYLELCMLEEEGIPEDIVPEFMANLQECHDIINSYIDQFKTKLLYYCEVEKGDKN